MPYKDLEIRRTKAKEYQAVHRLKVKQELASQPKEPRFCRLCEASIVGMRSNAVFCCREHKRKFSDSQRDHVAEYKRNATQRRATALRSYHADLERNRAKMRDRQKTNPVGYAVASAKRRAAKVQRTPHWLSEDDLWMIEQAYELAALRTKMFGFAWHVDHVIPLFGKKVSGLHTPYNLQVIPGSLNIAKNNRFEVIV